MSVRSVSCSGDSGIVDVEVDSSKPIKRFQWMQVGPTGIPAEYTFYGFVSEKALMRAQTIQTEKDNIHHRDMKPILNGLAMIYSVRYSHKKLKLVQVYTFCWQLKAL